MDAASGFVTVLQLGPFDDPNQFNPVVGLGSGAVGAFLSTFVVGAILLVLAPDWTRTHMRDLVEEPISAFVYGIVALVGLVVVTVVLAVTLIGIPIAILLAIVAYFVWVVGAVVGYLAIADRFVSVRDDWVVALLVAAALNGVLTLTGIGGIVSFCVGAAGFGTLLR